MIVVTGATGQFGHTAIEHLIDRGVAPETIVAAVRAPETASELANRGVRVRHADYDQPETLAPAFEGADKLLFVSSGGPNEQRIAHHRAVVEAAKQADVGLVAYTSLVQADTNPMALAEVHRDTERALEESGVPTVLLRNGWYTENYTANLAYAVDHGVILGCAGEGRIAGATRAELAEAAAVVLTSEDQAGKVYELTGDTAWSLEDLAAAASGHVDKPVVYRDVAPEEYAGMLAQMGLPPHMVGLIVDADVQLAQGALEATSKDLRKLLGRPTRQIDDVVRETIQH